LSMYLSDLHLHSLPTRRSSDLLNEGSFACVLVSHDRYFLENVATEIVDLNRVYADGLLRVKGSYSKFLEGKQAYMEAQSKLQDADRKSTRLNSSHQIISYAVFC